MSAPDGSLAGVLAVTTSIAHVDGKKGEALVRGYPLPDLARCSYEEVARLVLEGELPSAEQLVAFRAELRKGARTSRLPPALSPTAASLPESLVAAVACTGDIEPQATTAAHVLGRMPDACALAVGHERPPATLSYAGRGLRALGARRLDATAERALEVLLILESEHGLSASTFATRVAASSGASLPAALAAGTATLGGPRHGGATQEVHAFLRAAMASGDVAGYARKQTRIPGFGHRVYKVPDPRAPPLLEAIRSLGAVPLSAAAGEVEDALRPRLAPKGVHANIDYHAAVLLDALGIAPEAFVAAFALGIACGWLAHAVEQRALGRLIRPDSVYTGPALRAVPARPSTG
jgi:citrate synthase